MIEKENKLFVSVYAWQNDLQDYVVAGNLLFGHSEETQFTTTSFHYDKSYVKNGFGALDPANLDPAKDDLYVCSRPSGQLFGYFSALLPGQFGNQILADIDPIWPTLNEIQKLHVLTLAHGDFGSIHLNAHNNQVGKVIDSFGALNEVVEKIRAFQQRRARSILTPELEGALCSLGGSKPKVDFEVSADGRVQRYVVKLNSSDFFNDARVSTLMADSQKSARITVCPRKAQSLPCGEDVLICTNYARKWADSNGEEEARVIRFNRVNFRTLLENDSVLGVGEQPKIQHLIHAIDRYSDNARADKEELFRRTLFSVGTNHTANGFDNFEMYDTGRGKWRLSPSYSNLPSPDRGTNFQVGMETGASCSSLIHFDERWVAVLGGKFGYTPIESLGLALPVVQSLEALPVRIDNSNLMSADQAALKQIIPSEQIAKLAQKINRTPEIVDEAKRRYGLQAVPPAPTQPKGPTGGGGPKLG